MTEDVTEKLGARILSMSKPSDTLSEDEVRQISRIVEILNQSTFDYLQLEIGGLKLTISKGNATPGASEQTRAPAPAALPGALQTGANAAPANALPQPPAKEDVDDGSVDVVAPLIGRFFSQPEPGAASFVSLGSEVKEDTTVGLIEAMKMFSAVPAGVSGVITDIRVQDATLVEFGQVLFRVRPK